jgi:hypothetical protein
VSILDGCLRLSHTAQSAKGGSSVSLELSVKLFKNIFTSGEQPVAHGDVPVPRESYGNPGLCYACGKSGINRFWELGLRRWLPAPRSDVRSIRFLPGVSERANKASVSRPRVDRLLKPGSTGNPSRCTARPASVRGGVFHSISARQLSGEFRGKDSHNMP